MTDQLASICRYVASEHRDASPSTMCAVKTLPRRRHPHPFCTTTVQHLYPASSCSPMSSRYAADAADHADCSRQVLLQQPHHTSNWANTNHTTSSCSTVQHHTMSQNGCLKSVKLSPKFVSTLLIHGVRYYAPAPIRRIEAYGARLTSVCRVHRA